MIAQATPIVQTLAFEGNIDKDVIFVLVGGFVGVVGILAWAITSMSNRSAQERTRREIAAYVAEGTMTPDDGERLLKAAAMGELATKLAEEGKTKAAVDLALGREKAAKA